MKEKKINQELANMIKEYRTKTRRETQEGFADYCRVGKRTVQSWEGGEKIPSMNSIKRIFMESPQRMDEAFALRDKIILRGDNDGCEQTKNIEPQQTVSVDNWRPNIDTKFYKKTAFQLSKKIKKKKIPYKKLSQNLIIPKGVEYNSNTIVIGSSGSGKGYYYIRPNIKLLDSNYLVLCADEDIPSLFPSNWDVKVLDLSQPDKTVHYNPFKYFSDEKEVQAFSEEFCRALGAPGEMRDNFSQMESWVLGIVMRHVYQSVKDPSLKTVSDIVSSEGLNDYIDIACTALNEKNRLKLCPSKTAKSVQISLGERLQILNVSNVSAIFEGEDELALTDFSAKEHKAVIVTHNEDCTFLYNLILHQVTRIMVKNGAFSNTLQIICDNFADWAPQYFEFLLAVDRKYNVSIDVIIQSVSQLESIYSEGIKTLSGLVKAFVFFGSHDMATAKFASAKAGTISAKAETFDGELLHSIRNVPVLEPGQLLCMNKDECLVITDAYNAVMDKKM